MKPAPVTFRKDNVRAVTQAAITNWAGLMSFSGADDWIPSASVPQSCGTQAVRALTKISLALLARVY